MAKKNENETFSISELAQQLDISSHTIRFYEEKGLISPERTAGNQRIYTKKDRVRLKLILRGKRFGFTLDEIASTIGMADSEITENEQIEKSLLYAKEKLADLRQRREELDLLEKDMLALHEYLQKRQKDLSDKNKGAENV
ncbi:MerR family transcriptional regulator [Desulforegula conservatrix]|uniref:MerR family transcriptional regulator n=1 Tax=Desulforegula conservatrix TaxID=153026 RepID=UPI0004241726|nr:MerR family DNA-binding transcriptional regulator [Desulforegula conservatrix]